jgi:hypothetical protein
MTDESIDLVLFQKEADTIDVCINRIGLVLHHGREIELWLADDNTEIGEVMACEIEHFRRMQQSFGRNTADIETGAAMRFALFDNSHFHAELSGANGANITTGTGANDNKIVGHDVAPQIRRLRSNPARLDCFASLAMTIKGRGQDGPDLPALL